MVSRLASLSDHPMRPIINMVKIHFVARGLYANQYYQIMLNSIRAIDSFARVKKAI